jgi:hypothetical protein
VLRSGDGWLPVTRLPTDDVDEHVDPMYVAPGVEAALDLIGEVLPRTS